MQELVILAPAKINLTLDVKGKRPDGYHELETIMHQISLADVVRLRRRPKGIKVVTDSSLIPVDENNLAWRAAAEFFDVIGNRGGASIYIEKRIPVGAGLAGGSTDAAAVIKGLNTMYECNLEKNEILEIGARIGSDVPFCIQGGTVLARGRGEQMTPLHLARPLSLVLVYPGFSVSTREVYQGLADREILVRPDNRGVGEGLERGQLELVCRGMANVLETVTIDWHPEIADIKQRMMGTGAVKALMSGSGPTVFGVFRSQEAAVQTCDIIRNHYQEVFTALSWRG